MSDVDIGREVLRKYWSYSRQLYPGFFPSFDDFLLKLQPSQTKLKILMDGIGLGVSSAQISDIRIDTAMRSMASQSKGRLPSSNQDFFKYLSNEATKINWVDAASFVAVESTKDIIKGTAEVGESLISAGKAINYILPILIFTGVVIFFFSWIDKGTGGGAVKFIRAVRK